MKTPTVVWRYFFASAFVRYVSQHPFSVLALCNILGDLCWLGFAFHTEGFISFSKFLGAVFAIFAHLILLAFGDDQARKMMTESGWVAHFLLRLRVYAQRLVSCFPTKIQGYVLKRPVGIPFSMLMLNGVALLLDVILAGRMNAALMVQTFSGVIIIGGCGCFALADFIKSQLWANRLTKLAPAILVLATFAQIALALTTLNPFLIISVPIWMLSNFAGFFTKIDKEKAGIGVG